MFYVYARHIQTGKEQYIGSFDTEKEAVHKIAACYRIDARTCQEDEYYYLKGDVDGFCIALTGWSFENILKRAGAIKDYDQTFHQKGVDE